MLTIKQLEERLHSLGVSTKGFKLKSQYEKALGDYKPMIRENLPDDMMMELSLRIFSNSISLFAFTLNI